jgi:heptosyltransferase II
MPSRTVVVAPNWLGDAVMALPAIAALRAQWPDAALVVAGRASTVTLFSMVPGVDEVVRLDSRGGFIGAISWAEDAATLRSTRADVAVLLPNSFRSAWAAQRAGIPERWGYAADLRRPLLTRAVPRARGRFHHAEYYTRLVAALLGAPAAEAPATVGSLRLPRLQAPQDAERRADDLLERLHVTGPLVGLAPGAAYGTAKQWPPERYAELVVLLRDRLGATCLVFGARGADQRTASGVVSRKEVRDVEIRRNPGTASGPAAIDLAGQTDLPLLVALMARCVSVVCNDSGAMHVAAAAGVPVTAVFGASNEHGTAPLPCDVSGQPVLEGRSAPPHEILTFPAWCRPCMLRECPIDHRCMLGVSAAEAAAAVERQARQ